MSSCLDEAFLETELQKDKRLDAIQQEILARTIIEDPAGRIQSAQELLEVIERMLHSFQQFQEH